MSLPASFAPEPSPDPQRATPPTRRGGALDEQKRSFLRMVSHELRTPLNSIIGFSEIIAKELCGPLGSPQYKEYAEHVRQSGHKLLRLVNQVLEIARLEGHVTDLDLSAEPLDHAIDDALDTLREDIKTRNIQVVVEGEGALPSVLADPRGLRTILVNLLQNAVTFSHYGGEVRVRATRRLGRVDLEIEDDGEGISEAEIPRLLRPFEQGEAALTRSTEGAGLGLPIVNLLVLAMRGTLRLISEPGRGLKVVVALPPA
jgi:signal transduction histidine kinase